MYHHLMFHHPMSQSLVSIQQRLISEFHLPAVLDTVAAAAAATTALSFIHGKHLRIRSTRNKHD
jgi:hypothetical protein